MIRKLNARQIDLNGNVKETFILADVDFEEDSCAISILGVGIVETSLKELADIISDEMTRYYEELEE